MRTIPLLAVLALAACVRTSSDPATGKIDVDIESPTQKGEVWNASLKGQGTYSAMTGTAKATVVNGMTNVAFSLDGGTPGQTHPWHVHDGKCGSGGAVVGDASGYPPVTIGANGHGEASGHIMTRLDEAKDYHVNVHASAAEMATIIACGDLDD